MNTFSLLQWLVAALAAFCIGLSKSGIAGVSLAAILLTARIFPPRESTGIILPMLIMADFLACGAFRRDARWALVGRLLPAAVAGVVLGWLLMPRIAGGDYRRVLGWIVLLMALLQGLQMRYRHFSPPQFHGRTFATLMGVLAGGTTMLANAAGPVMALYLTAVRLPKIEFVATSAFFFLAINLIKVPFSASQGLITGSSLLFNLLLFPAIVLGVFFGKWIIVRISQRVFEWLLLSFSLAAALRLIAD